jgi:hypothetical protein
MQPEAGAGFDVEHVDEASRSQLIASNLSLDEAIRLAREEAQRRRVGRMFRAGSPDVRNVIVITERAAAS